MSAKVGMQGNCLCLSLFPNLKVLDLALLGLLKQWGLMGWATAMVTPGEEGGMDVKSKPTLPIVKIHSCVQSLNTSLLYTYHVPDGQKILAFLNLTV